MYNAPETTDKDGVTTHRRITRRASERVIRFALDWAASHSSSRITCVHKANVLRQSDGLFRTVFQAEAARYPALRAEESLVDSCAHDLVRDFRRFDVLVTLNLYGDILSDLAAGLAGGLGFAPSGNFGPRQALFEPVHGSAPPLAGKDVANPSGAILSAAMMLDYLGEHVRADRIRAAVRSAIRKGATRDAGGKLGTKAFTELVVAEIS
jgi:isocitrate/isopropylmalate dehydrogenase